MDKTIVKDGWLYRNGFLRKNCKIRLTDITQMKRKKNLFGEALILYKNQKKIAKISARNDMYPEFWTHIYKLGGHHGCFSVFYRRHPFCFCLDSFVIIVINIFINSNCKFFK